MHHCNSKGHIILLGEKLTAAKALHDNRVSTNSCFRVCAIVLLSIQCSSLISNWLAVAMFILGDHVLKETGDHIVERKYQ